MNPDFGRHLYFIQSDVTGAIKIGRTENPGRRLKQLQTGSPHALRIILVLPDRGTEETRFHRMMRGYETGGGEEWFSETCLGELPIPVYEKLPVEVLDQWWVPKKSQ